MIHHQHSSDHDPEDDDQADEPVSDHETHRQHRKKLCHHASLSHLRSSSGYDHHTLPVQHGHSHHSHSHSGKSATIGRKSSTGSHHHHHHHYHHRRHRIHHHDHHRGTNPRKNRSHTDVSNTSVNTCHESCPDQEVREILIQRPCCSSSKTEIVQYFIEDLYGPSGRISCCTSSDYCYHTDSTSLYGSRSSLSRNGSIKSGSATIRRKRSAHHRQVPYSSASLGKLNRSNPNSIDGSLASIFDKPRDKGGSGGKMVVSPSKITVENPKKDSSKCPVKCTNSECGYKSSPIRWSFLADNESKTPSDDLVRGGAAAVTSQDESDSMRKYTDYSEESHESRSSTLSRTESNTVVFHQEGEAANNCCNNYIQYNAYLDQDLQITSEDICGYLSLSKDKEGEVLNNSVNYPFQPTNALEFQYRKNFHVSNSNSPELNYHNQQRQQQRLNSKETNINQNISESMALSPTNINLSSSSNNINIIFNSYAENSAPEVKFINTTRENNTNVEGQQSSFIHQHSYPNYEYNNMSANSLFDKPLGIDEIPSSSSNARTSTATTPENFFETTSSHHNLLYYRQSSFRECNSTTSSFTNASVNPNYNNSPAGDSIEASNNLHAHQQSDHQLVDYNQHHPATHQFHQNYPHQAQQPFHQQHFNHHHRHCTTTHRWQHVSENLKIGNALKLVRKRARKCAQYLRKK